MRSRALPARALARILAGSQQQSSSTATTAAAAASASSSTAGATSSNGPTGRLTSTSSSSSHTSSSLSSVRAARLSSATRRRQESIGSTFGPSTLRRRRSTSSQRTRTSAIEASSAAARNKAGKTLPSTTDAGHAWPLRLAGITPVHPPQTSFINVALQNFFAAQRPLLEHQVVRSPSLSSQGANGVAADQASYEDGTDEETRSKLESISAALVQSLHDAGKLSAEDLEHATVVIASVGDSLSAHAKHVEGLPQDRFNALIDRLSAVDSSSSGVDVVRQEAKELEKEANQSKDVEVAVSNALERGEDTTVAQALGTEADLIVLGEPEGPNPSWARGVATYLAQSTRAFEPPSAPVQVSKQQTQSSNQEVHASIKILDERDDDPNLIFSHALLQATVPPALAWDRIVAQMESATLNEGQDVDRRSAVVDVSALNASLPVAATKNDADVLEDGNDVSLDSTRRKRKKKMRKHKYRKLRKLTRIERSRLKK